MKKIFTLLAALLLAVGSQAKDYKDSLVVTVNGVVTEQNATVALTQDADGLYTFSLKNFILEAGGQQMGIGTITIDKLQSFQAGGNIMLQTSRNLTITEGDIASPSGKWIGPMLGDIPINLTAKISDEKVYASIAITMATLGQTIDVTFGSGYQLPNSGFENFYDESNGKGLMVPCSWHSFGSAKGTLAAIVSGTPHTYQNDNTRPGSTGVSCALIKSTSVFGIVANGTMTTGRMNAGNMTAANTDNHAELDMSQTSKDNNGDPYYTAMAGRPDSLVVWVKFQQGKANKAHPYATVSAAITDGTYYQDPQDKTYSNVLATAKNNQIASNGGEWQRLSIPFTYVNDDDVEGKAILVTLSTNADAGQGSNGDQLYVDDIQFIYNAGIASREIVDGKVNVTLNGKGAFANTVYSERDGHNIATVTVYSDDLKTQTTQEFDLGTTGISAIINHPSPITQEQTLRHGLNIVRQPNGTAKELIVR